MKNNYFDVYNRCLANMVVILMTVFYPTIEQQVSVLHSSHMTLLSKAYYFFCWATSEANQSKI